jgi:cytochrome c oxidase subunit III
MTKTVEATKKVNEQSKKIHPHKFTLWIGIGSIVMMFAGLTSAYIVKRDQPGWTTFEVPRTLWFSTAVMLSSSLTVQLAVQAFRGREMRRYRNLLTATILLGILFVALQWISFRQIWASGVTFRGSGAGQFLYVIAGLHALHVLGGIIVFLIMFAKAYSRKIRIYNAVPIEMARTYWNFVDVLWLYLFIFFLWIQ